MKKIGSGQDQDIYLFDFYNEIFLRVIEDITNDVSLPTVYKVVFILMQQIAMVLSVCVALIIINDNSCFSMEQLYTLKLVLVVFQVFTILVSCLFDMDDDVLRVLI